jgi:hypothetical protein
MSDQQSSGNPPGGSSTVSYGEGTQVPVRSVAMPSPEAQKGKLPPKAGNGSDGETANTANQPLPHPTSVANADVKPTPDDPTHLISAGPGSASDTIPGADDVPRSSSGTAENSSASDDVDGSTPPLYVDSRGGVGGIPPSPPKPFSKENGMNSKRSWILGSILAILLIVFGFKACRGEEKVAAPSTTPNATVTNVEDLAKQAKASADASAKSEAAAAKSEQEAASHAKSSQQAASAAAASASAASKPVKAAERSGRPKGTPDAKKAQAKAQPSAAPTNSWARPPPQEVKSAGPPPTASQMAEATVRDGPPYVLIRKNEPPAPWHVGQMPCRDRCTVEKFVRSLPWPSEDKAAMIEHVRNSSPDTNIKIRNGDYFEAMAYGDNKVQFNVVATWAADHVEPARVWRLVIGMFMREVALVQACTNLASNSYHVRYVLPAPPAQDFGYLGSPPITKCPPLPQAKAS